MGDKARTLGSGAALGRGSTSHSPVTSSLFVSVVMLVPSEEFFAVTVNTEAETLGNSFCYRDVASAKRS